MSPSFYALRDGNAATIPANYRAPDYEAQSFRITDFAKTVAMSRIRRAGTR